MKKSSFFILFLLTVFLTGGANAADAQVIKIKALHDREIAARGELELANSVTKASFSACIPRESKPFSKEVAPALSEKIFSKKALADWMRCNQKDCAFNFLPNEIATLEKFKTEDERKKMYFRFYKDRTEGKTPLDPGRTRFFIKSNHKAFDFCHEAALEKLLDKRPLIEAFRLSFVQYSDQMRPTARLTQGAYYPQGAGFCYAEALIFSDHYDDDRVEVWKAEPLEKGGTKLRLQVRHRIDLLSTWVRRLNINAFQRELESVIQKQMKEAAECLKALP